MDVIRNYSNNRIFAAFVIFICSTTSIFSQSIERNKPKFKRHYYLKKSVFEALPNSSDEIIFLGNSITAGGQWTEMFNDTSVKNRGISGDITEGILFRLNEITESNPLKIFLMIGINDLSKGLSVDSIFFNYNKILESILKDTPLTQLYIQSILPVNDEYEYFKNHTNKGDSILLLNEKLEKLANGNNIIFINLFPHFANDSGKLNKVYTFDGLHLNGNGYNLWKSIIENDVLN